MDNIMSIIFFIYMFLSVIVFLILDHKCSSLKKKLNNFEGDYWVNWYNIVMDIAKNKNDITYLTEFLEKKYPKMHSEMMEKYSKNLNTEKNKND